MNNKLRILLCITVLSVLPLIAGDAETKSLSVEQRLREMDLSLTIRQYERLRMEAFETRLKLELLDTEEDMTETVRKKRAELLDKRYEILHRRASELRDTAIMLGDQIAAAKSQ